MKECKGQASQGLIIQISPFYKNKTMTEIGQLVQDEIESHEVMHGVKPQKVIVAPYHEWNMHKADKTQTVICL